MRCGYNVVGTKTGRLSCHTSPTGSGFNLQTVAKRDRDLFLPDPGYWLFECDLSGADGWTVAAHCAAHGDHTMLEDLQAGLKPAKEIVLMRRHGRQVLSWSRERLLAEEKGVPKDGWEYFAGKQAQHGGSYGMKAETLSDTILKTSYKIFGEPLAVPVKVCEDLLQLFFLRYPGILRWHAWISQQLRSRGYLVSANGHKRLFFGQKDDHNTFKEACADEPQNNTTYAMKLALRRLWTDEDNRQPAGLSVQPLHQVHDSLIGQFRKEDTVWSVSKLREWFNNPLTIAGQTITIPFEGKYGESWGNLSEGDI